MDLTDNNEFVRYAVASYLANYDFADEDDDDNGRKWREEKRDREIKYVIQMAELALKRLNKREKENRKIPLLAEEK